MFHLDFRRLIFNVPILTEAFAFMVGVGRKKLGTCDFATFLDLLINGFYIFVVVNLETRALLKTLGSEPLGLI